MVELFNEDGLKELCFLLPVDYDSLSGDNKSAKARELILYMKNKGRLDDLVEKCKELRANAEW
jgi:hypothetical protein